MRISLLWLHFAGAHLVLLAALVCLVVVFRLRRADRIRRFGATCIAGFQTAGIVLFVPWLSMSDPLFWHRQGPAALLFPLLTCSAIGLAGGLVFSLSSFVSRDWGRSILSAVVVLLILPSLFVVACGAWRLPTALREVRLQHVEDLWGQGARAVPQLVAALDDDDPYVQSSACFGLSQIGPAAREAAPALVSYLDRTVGSRTAARLEAIGALAKTSPEQAVPVFVRAVALGKTSWYERRAMRDALLQMGPNAAEAWNEIVRYDETAAARGLPGEIERLASTDPAEVERAAKALDAMGAYAGPALPVLQKRAGEIKIRTGGKAPFDKTRLAWVMAANAIDGAVFHISLAARLEASHRRPTRPSQPPVEERR